MAIIYADAIMLHVSRARVCLYYSNLAAQQRTPVFIWITVRYSIIIDIVCAVCAALTKSNVVSNEVCFNNRRNERRRERDENRIANTLCTGETDFTDKAVHSEKRLEMRAV